MPDPEKLLLTLRRAVVAFRSTPGRKGRVVELQDADEVLVLGDLHGHLGNFQAGLRRADLAKHPRRHLVLQELIHGPFRYPDGSDKSHQLLDLAAALKCQFPRQVHVLLGNHELSQATGRRIAKGDREYNDDFRGGVLYAYKGHGEAVYATYLQLIAALPVALRTPNRVFLSHSLPSGTRLPGFDPAVLEKDTSDPADLLPGGSVHALVWGRDTDAEHTAAFLQRVNADWLVSGHVACPDEGFARPNPRQLILDSLGQPAACCLLPAGRPLADGELHAGVELLHPPGPTA
jgi:hypothetical protein